MTLPTATGNASAVRMLRSIFAPWFKEQGLVEPAAHMMVIADALAAADARIARLEGALDALVNAEWMVTHDWGGDRDTVLEKARAALAARQGEKP